MKSRLGSVAGCRGRRIGARWRIIGWGLRTLRLPLEAAKQHDDDVLDVSLKEGARRQAVTGHECLESAVKVKSQ